MGLLVVLLRAECLPVLVGLQYDLVDLVPALPKVELVQLLLVVALLVLALHARQHRGDQLDLARDFAGEVLVESLGEVVEGVIEAELKPAKQIFLGLAEGFVVEAELVLIALLIALEDRFFEYSFNFRANFEDGRLDQGEQRGVKIATVFLLFLGTAPLELFPFWFLDIVDIILLEVMLVLDMGVGCSIGEVALPALAQVVPALWILPLPPGALAVLLHRL